MILKSLMDWWHIFSKSLTVSVQEDNERRVCVENIRISNFWNNVASPDLLYSYDLHKKTNNQQRIDDLHLYDNTNIPDEFCCFLSKQIMDIPILLVKENRVVDLNILEINGRNPFTNLRLQKSDVQECLKLKNNINSFVASHVIKNRANIRQPNI